MVTCFPGTQSRAEAGKRLSSHLPAGKEWGKSCRAILTALPASGAAEHCCWTVLERGGSGPA